MKKRIRGIAIILTIVMIASLPSISMAESSEGNENQGTVEINSFVFVDADGKNIEEKIESQSFKKGITIDDIKWADKIKINGSDELIDINWDGKETFDGNRAGTYKFTAVLPEGYTMAEGVGLPTITATIGKADTIVSGLLTTRTALAGKTLSDTISVSPAYGRTVYLQRYYNGKWYTKATYTTSNQETSTIKLVYTNDWYAAFTTTWRVYVPETEENAALISKVKISVKSVYQTPGNYLKIKDVVPVRKSGYSLKVGMSGMKVYKVQKKLGVYSGHAKYGYSTKSAVKKYQKKKGLEVTGVVDEKTWLKMGFSSKSWYYLDSYVTEKKIGLSATKKQYVNTMIKTAKSYLGTRYVWCASARPKQGIDCAGLVMQCMYSVGIDPLPQGSHVYAYSKNEYTTRRLWANKKLKHVSYNKKKPGDLIFYGRVINHVAIYVGNGRIIEAMPGGVRYNSVKAYTIHGVARPII